jgi:hypothetical protein
MKGWRSCGVAEMSFVGLRVRTTTYDLVDRRDVLGLAGEKVGQVLNAEVAAVERSIAFGQWARDYSRDSDSLDKTHVPRNAASLPSSGANLGPSFRAMHEVEIGVVESGLLEADLDGIDDSLRVLLVVHELGREPDLRTRYAGGLDELVDRLSAIALVLVPFGAVDMLAE